MKARQKKKKDEGARVLPMAVHGNPNGGKK